MGLTRGRTARRLGSVRASRNLMHEAHLDAIAARRVGLPGVGHAAW